MTDWIQRLVSGTVLLAAGIVLLLRGQQGLGQVLALAGAAEISTQLAVISGPQLAGVVANALSGRSGQPPAPPPASSSSTS